MNHPTGTQRIRCFVAAVFFAASTLVSGQAIATAPIERIWIRAASQPAALGNIAPEVHSVEVNPDNVRVSSAGLSLQSFGILAQRPASVTYNSVELYEFNFPRAPRKYEPVTSPDTGQPVTILGSFVNGVPIFSTQLAASYHDQNLWHLDSVAIADNGTLTATGRELPMQRNSGTPALLQAVLERNFTHSPILGFAMDGYPIYGPYGWTTDQRVTRCRSSYQLRKINRRDTLPDGTRLTPAQDGPAVSPEYPLGTFVEDYEYVSGSGDLDEHNGRFALTPEFPNGTYAYFLSSQQDGRLTYPYLLGPTLAGQTFPQPSLSQISSNLGLSAGLHLAASTAHPRAGQAVDWLFTPPTSLERVHERPIHVLLVSKDLSEMHHIHPEPVTRRSYRLQYTFSRGGDYWLFADFTPAGGTQTIARFPIHVDGSVQPAKPLRAAQFLHLSAPPVTVGGLCARLRVSSPLQAGRDLTLGFDLEDATTHQPVTDLEPYLGAWGHIMLVRQDGSDFIHAHPKEAQPAVDTNPWQHTHAAPGPGPSTIETQTGFRRPGLYQMWLQVQREGQVITFPFTLQVAPAPTQPTQPLHPLRPHLVLASAESTDPIIAVQVNNQGFQPSRIPVPAGRPIRLAFTRTDAENCASRIVFPSLKLEKDLPVGKAVVVTLPVTSESEIRFGCGMGMYRGAVVVLTDAEQDPKIRKD